MKKSFRTVSGGGGQIPGRAWRRPRPLTREFPTNSGVGVGPPGHQKSRPEGQPNKEEQHSDHAECCGEDAVICLLELRF